MSLIACCPSPSAVITYLASGNKTGIFLYPVFKATPLPWLWSKAIY